MNSQYWYNQGVAEKFEKKEIPVTMKIPESLRQVLEEIGRSEDRPLGYVARELMIRGLNLFKNDGLLREPVSQSERLVNDIERKPQTIPPGGIPLAPHSKNKIPFYSGRQEPVRKKKSK